MSKVDKLSILGLRSFDNQHAMTIQFYTPLTLIVGTNGSGKTTIIECLKYAATGIVPPNTDKGATFIHDAKLCGESEVLAQVKLGFKSIEGIKSVCTRSVQLTAKKTTRTFKTLEGNVKMVRDGQTINVSSKQTSLDTLMPQLMGVSKAILDGVIFCHQEESLWPLQKSSDLKVRFDQIFDAQKYTKAVEALKIMQKTKRTDLAQLKADEFVAKSDNDRAKKARFNIQKLDDETAELRTKMEEVGEQLREAEHKVKTAHEQGRAAREVVGKLHGKRIEWQTKDESVKSLRENLIEMTDSDEDLQRMLEQYKERVGEYQGELESKQEEYQEVGNRIKQARQSLNIKERECGSYEAEKTAHERQIERREQLVKETARSHGIHGFDGSLDADRVKEFVHRITKKASEQRSKFNEAQEKTREELQRTQSRLDRISEQRSAYNQQRDSSRQTIVVNDQKVRTFQQALNKIRIDEGNIVTLESRVQDVQNRLQDNKITLENSNVEDSIHAEDAELRRLEDSKEKLEAELIEGTRKAGDSARLDYVRKECKDRQRSLQTMIDAHGKRIGSIVGGEWSPSKLEADYQRKVNECASQVAEAERQRDGTNREMEQMDFQLSVCRSDLKSKEASLKAAAEKIHIAVSCQPHEYTDEVEKLEGSRDYLKGDADSFKMMLDYFNSCIKAAKEKSACRTCSRALKGKEIDILLRTMEKEKKNIENSMDLETLKQTEEDLKAAKAVSSDFDLWERLKEKEIPQLRTEEKNLTQKKEKLAKQLESQDDMVDEVKVTQREIDGLGHHVQSIVKYHSEITSFETQIDDLAARQASTEISRGLDAIQDDIKAMNSETRNTKSRLNKLTTERDRTKDTINVLEVEYHDAKGKLNAAEFQLKERKTLETQVEEYKVMNNEEREKIKSIESSLQDLAPELAKEQATRDDLARRRADEDQEFNSELNKLDNSVSHLRQANQDIQAYYTRNGPANLERAKKEANQLQNEIGHLEQDQGSLVREVKALEDQLRNHDATKRSIADNQRYRRDLRQVQVVAAEIEELESTDAEAENTRCENLASRYGMQCNELSAAWQTLGGQMGSKDEELQRQIAEYDTEYKNAAKRYKEAHILVETTDAAIGDIGRYWGALDKAIMKFHEAKMEEINRIIEELWRKTYQGTDVDTILIRSEHEASPGKKSYNYRVVMVKQDVEMDMRGRCSAGQKVLACIIIRLALAECFGVNCGLIALDEPTTNLDRDNIRALALSLAEIIRVRRAQRNFQLIVITHDEEFLQLMGCADFTDYYYRVSRDERQKSVIERQNINEVL